MDDVKSIPRKDGCTRDRNVKYTIPAIKTALIPRHRKSVLLSLAGDYDTLSLDGDLNDFGRSKAQSVARKIGAKSKRNEEN